MSAARKFEELCTGGEVSGPIAESKIAAAEAELGVIFPSQYRDFLAKYGAVVLDGVEIFGLPAPELNEPPLWQDVTKVTSKLRNWSQAGAENPNYIPIAEDGTGIYFFLDANASPETRVVAIGPGVERIVASDLASFVVELSEGRLEL